MPTCLRRAPTTLLQPVSTTPEPICWPCARTSRSACGRGFSRCTPRTRRPSCNGPHVPSELPARCSGALPGVPSTAPQPTSQRLADHPAAGPWQHPKACRRRGRSPRPGSRPGTARRPTARSTWRRRRGLRGARPSGSRATRLPATRGGRRRTAWDRCLGKRRCRARHALHGRGQAGALKAQGLIPRAEALAARAGPRLAVGEVGIDPSLDRPGRQLQGLAPDIRL